MVSNFCFSNRPRIRHISHLTGCFLFMKTGLMQNDARGSAVCAWDVVIRRGPVAQAPIMVVNMSTALLK